MQSSISVAKTRPRFQDANMVKITAKYIDTTISFSLSLTCGLAELQHGVARRLMLEAGTFRISYENELGEWILISCDEELQVWLDASIWLVNTSTVVFLEPK